MSARFLCVVVFVIAVAGWSRAAQSQPGPLLRGAESSLLRERADAAVELESSRRTTQWLSLAVAVVVFGLVAFGLWWLSSRWVSYAPLQWLALVVIPVLFAFAVVWWSRDSVQSKLDNLPEQALRRIADDPVLGADHGRVEAARRVLSLKATAHEGHLLRTLAMRPTLYAAGGALVLVIGLWIVTNRRVLKSA